MRLISAEVFQSRSGSEGFFLCLFLIFAAPSGEMEESRSPTKTQEKLICRGEEGADLHPLH